MSLIEQLGGYEKAKEIAFDPLHPQMTHVSNDGRHWVNEEFSYIPGIREQIPTMARIDDIRKALLEYRRQHNIFEVGDPMIIPSRGNGIFYFNALFSDSDIAEARHATDEEIKAGKRLEVNDGIIHINS